MTKTYPRWFPAEKGPVAVDYDRSTLNFPYISLSIIVLSGVLSPFLLLIIIHPLVDFIVGSLLYALALLMAVRLAYRFFGRKPLTTIVKDNIIIVKYLFKKKTIRPDNIESVEWSNLEIGNTSATVYISTSHKPIVLHFDSFTNSDSLMNQLVKICSLNNLDFPQSVSQIKHETIPVTVNNVESNITGVRKALYRKLS